MIGSRSVTVTYLLAPGGFCLVASYLFVAAVIPASVLV